ncbi:MAG: aminoacyl-tRNA hydrolase, partial [SAR202 cluster bacterium]|nr:aminoacyl-tRNA hydrolase [SAR202 cluster bacterium]
MLFKKESIKNPDLIILGIGNPGSEYSLTRHNVGIWAIDQLSKYTEIKIKKKKEKIQYGEGI